MFTGRVSEKPKFWRWRPKFGALFHKAASVGLEVAALTTITTFLPPFTKTRNWDQVSVCIRPKNPMGKASVNHRKFQTFEPD